MKVLLIGEYNRVHKNIKNGLIALGHEAIVVGLKDGFKKVDVDIELKHYYTKGLLKTIRNVLLYVLNIDLHAISLQKQIKKLQSQLSGYHIVQFINEAPFWCKRSTQLKLFKKLIKWNNKSFLLSCGTDYISVKYAFDKKFRYSILTPYFNGKGTRKDFSPALSYLKPNHLKIHRFLMQHIKGVITNDLDYYLPYKNHLKHIGFIPHAIDVDRIKFKPLKVEGKIVIFHGINRGNYYKKGNDFFEKALAIIEKKHPNKVTISTVENLVYKDYIKAFDKAHILLDQVYAYDQGYNALEAMAKGKVVFTGAEQEWLDYYNLKEDTIAINALPNVEQTVNKLEWLILNPEKIVEISKNARAFVEQEHNYLKLTKQYLEIWNKH